MDKIVNLFAVKNTGFMVVSRSAFATLLNMIQSHNWVSIYGYLLFCAQFGIPKNKNRPWSTSRPIARHFPSPNMPNWPATT